MTYIDFEKYPTVEEIENILSDELTPFDGNYKIIVNKKDPNGYSVRIDLQKGGDIESTIFESTLLFTEGFIENLKNQLKKNAAG